MDAQTKEVIHAAIARKLSEAFPSIDIDIITAVLEAKDGDPGR